MDRQPVISSSIASVGYDPTSETLEVEFSGGNVYQFYGVPDQAHLDLVGAPSIGGYFNANIRQQYSYARL